MHRSSDTIGAIATALAKAQAELNHPERTLTATILAKDGERTFRYASLANGLDLVRKCLGQHEIAVMQTTAVDQSQIMLTTLLVHASGEWVSSIWPVCQAAEPSAHVKGAALTYARRYALFTIVGIAGEDDLDAPELSSPVEQPRTDPSPPRKPSNGKVHLPRLPPLAREQSIQLRDKLLQEISAIDTDDALALWAHRSMPLKNSLIHADAQILETAYLKKVGLGGAVAEDIGEPADRAQPPSGDDEPTASRFHMPLTKPTRIRSKAHLAFVASQSCLICKTNPCDAHHVKIAQPRALGRKVSDEYTVPLCRKHHQDLHRNGSEAAWWANMQIAPIPIAKELWELSPAHGAPAHTSQISGLKRAENHKT